MKYELTEQEVNHIEMYCNLLDEYRDALDENVQTLFELQTKVIKELI